MASVNKVTILGNLTRDPEVSYLASGKAVCNISIATSESWRDKTTGEKKEQAEFHRVVFYDKLAEIVGEYGKKGSPLYIEGSLHYRKFQDKATGADKYITEIKGQTMQLLGGRPPVDAGMATARQSAQAPADDFQDETIPF